MGCVVLAEVGYWLIELLLFGIAARFWLIYEPVLSATIIATVDSTLATQTPAFLDSIRMTTFTLGTKAPRIDHVRTFPATEDDIVMMDWQFSFTPNVRLSLMIINEIVCVLTLT